MSREQLPGTLPDDVRVPVVGREMLRQMKLASGRDKDLVDAELLGSFDE